MILSPECPADEELEDEKFLSLYQEATDLYGLIHSRYILTPRGLALMRERMFQGRFGQCPRVFCQAQNTVPIGLSDDLKVSRVKIFCPKCGDVYVPKKKCADVDGAYFGSAFPHILLYTYPDLSPEPPKLGFEAKIYGFKLHKKAETKQLSLPEEKPAPGKENEELQVKEVPEKGKKSKGKKGKKGGPLASNN
eukprot:TRINITY_DN2684_c0_g1_i11.p1 TRINITY_DN2684_c0_g1~~TRINITY_DN2684_c0_g1_i11.p1  ORF type:complete len:193 (+),score=55.10 TRINITY_DN2684_c0_g1_i11:380-958(+)